MKEQTNDSASPGDGSLPAEPVGFTTARRAVHLDCGRRHDPQHAQVRIRTIRIDQASRGVAKDGDDAYDRCQPPAPRDIWKVVSNAGPFGKDEISSLWTAASSTLP